jgi:hypothetical protein
MCIFNLHKKNKHSTIIIAHQKQNTPLKKTHIKELSNSAAHISCCFRKLNKNQVLSPRARRKKCSSSFSRRVNFYFNPYKRPEADFFCGGGRARSEHLASACAVGSRERWIWVLFLRESMQKRKCSGGNPPCAISLQSHNPRRRAGEGREREKEQDTFHSAAIKTSLHLFLPATSNPAAPCFKLFSLGNF